MMGIPFSMVSYAITAAIVLWILSDPQNNTKMFISIPSIAVLTFSYIVLGTDWSAFGEPIESLRLFFAGMVAIPYVVSSGFAFFLRVYAYMWAQARKSKSRKKHGKKELSIEALLEKR